MKYPGPALWDIRDGRPRIAMWLKWHYTYLAAIPWLGWRVWKWANDRVERWHARRAA